MKKILVVVDMQNDFTTGVLGNDQCKAVISKITNYINEDGKSFDKIILTKDTHKSNYMETQEGRRLPIEHCIEGTNGWQIVDSIMEAVKDTGVDYYIINKPTFGSIDLLQYVQNHSDDEVEYTFVGVCTGICVISNVMLTKAANPDAIVKVIADMCACVTVDSHRIALEAMKTCQVDII